MAPIVTPELIVEMPSPQGMGTELNDAFVNAAKLLGKKKDKLEEMATAIPVLVAPVVVVQDRKVQLGNDGSIVKVNNKEMLVSDTTVVPTRVSENPSSDKFTVVSAEVSENPSSIKFTVVPAGLSGNPSSISQAVAMSKIAELGDEKPVVSMPKINSTIANGNDGFPLKPAGTTGNLPAEHIQLAVGGSGIETPVSNHATTATPDSFERTTSNRVADSAVAALLNRTSETASAGFQAVENNAIFSPLSRMQESGGGEGRGATTGAVTHNYPHPAINPFRAQETSPAGEVRSAGAVHALRNPSYTPLPQVGEGVNSTSAKLLEPAPAKPLIKEAPVSNEVTTAQSLGTTVAAPASALAPQAQPVINRFDMDMTVPNLGSSEANRKTAGTHSATTLKPVTPNSVVPAGLSGNPSSINQTVPMSKMAEPTRDEKRVVSMLKTNSTIATGNDGFPLTPAGTTVNVPAEHTQPAQQPTKSEAMSPRRDVAGNQASQQPVFDAQSRLAVATASVSNASTEFAQPTRSMLSTQPAQQTSTPSTRSPELATRRNDTPDSSPLSRSQERAGVRVVAMPQTQPNSQAVTDNKAAPAMQKLQQYLDGKPRNVASMTPNLTNNDISTMVDTKTVPTLREAAGFARPTMQESMQSNIASTPRVIVDLTQQPVQAQSTTPQTPGAPVEFAQTKGVTPNKPVVKSDKQEIIETTETTPTLPTTLSPQSATIDSVASAAPQEQSTTTLEATKKQAEIMAIRDKSAEPPKETKINLAWGNGETQTVYLSGNSETRYKLRTANDQVKEAIITHNGDIPSAISSVESAFDKQPKERQSSQQYHQDDAEE